MRITDLFEAQVLGTDVQTWLWAALTFAATLACVWVLRWVTLWRLAARAKRTASLWDDVIVDVARRTKLAAAAAVAALVASTQLDLPPTWQGRVHGSIALILLVQLGLWGHGIVHYGIVALIDRRGDSDDQIQKTSRNMLRFLASLVVWVTVGFLIANQFGVSPNSVIAGLSVTGLALTLATQGIVADIFASMSVLLDKPFVLGDFIIVDDVMGTVERIGIKTTRLRSLSGESVIVSNSDLTKCRVRNFRNMPTRRIVFTFRLALDTPVAVLEQVPNWVRQDIDKESLARFDRAELLQLGDNGLGFEVVFYVLEARYQTYTAIQQRLNLQLLQRLAAAGARLGVPARQWQPAPGPGPATAASLAVAGEASS